MWQTLWLLPLLTWGILPASAAPPDDVAYLASEQTWLKLLHYRSSDGFGMNRSRIINQDFFIDPTGWTDPAAELSASLAAFDQLPTQNPNDHARCRYPARFAWLIEELGENYFTDINVECTALREWLPPGVSPRLSAVFVSGYFGNPASFFGHVLIVESSRAEDRAQLLNDALNFGALVPKNENPVVYIIKGLFGGYTSSFSNREFFNYNHSYGEEELRDLWVYPLHIDGAKARFLRLHMWELSRARFRYFFTKDNCGFEVSEYLSVVLDDLHSPMRPWYAPLDLFHALDGIQRSSGIFIKPIWLPSRISRFRRQYKALDRTQRRAFQAVLSQGVQSNPLNASGADLNLSGLDEDERAQVLDAVLTYSELKDDPEDAPQRETLRREALSRRTSLPAAGEAPVSRSPSPPHVQQRTSTVQLGAGLSNRESYGGVLRIRPAYQDLLTAGVEPSSRAILSAFELQLDVAPRQLTFRRLDIIHVESLGLGATGVKGDRSFAWQLRAGIVGEPESCGSCTGPLLEAGIGKASMIGKRSAALGMINVEGGIVNKGVWIGTIGPEVGLLVSPTDWLASEGRLRYDLGWTPKLSPLHWSMGARLGASPRWDLRLESERQGDRTTDRLLGSLHW